MTVRALPWLISSRTIHRLHLSTSGWPWKIAINKVEADTILSEGAWPTSEGLQVESDEPGLAKNIERSIRRGQGQDVTEIEAGEVPIGVAVLGIVLWLIFLGLCGFILWLWLSR
jgi:hypothetical protein